MDCLIRSVAKFSVAVAELMLHLVDCPVRLAADPLLFPRAEPDVADRLTPYVVSIRHPDSAASAGKVEMSTIHTKID